MTEPPVKFPLSSRPILTPRQLAERWQCSAAHVVKLVNSGALKGGRLGPRMVRIPIEAVEEFERRNTVGPKRDEAAAISDRAQERIIGAALRASWRRRPKDGT